MKRSKLIGLGFILAVGIMTLTACGSGKEDISKDEWGISLEAQEITDKGLTIVCTQDKEDLEGELQAGSPYWIEVKKDGDWSKADMLIPEDQVAWTMEIYTIPKGDSIEWEVNWQNLYGELSEGEYRIGKEISYYDSEGNGSSKDYYAEFSI